ncbi:signal recognition particle protein [Weissella tructae]|uniref:Signal recognition particle protein n=2 Tax=Weissella TaxID=46255 RepID=A0A075TY68_9LACO|nr:MULTISPECIES: signal recognition particle protein [Weissella]AIG65276.1 Signal recognition particle protein [Weissella tructae]AIM62589.1 Signal recognition particle protein [Weissella ceti]AIM63925.1 Signal recognition particle protein [Weissella ceti]ELA07678.1 signal recognition particle protein [Weissella ceti NC36]QVV91657.1 signal recognition particle protein [Weissella tructae]
MAFEGLTERIQNAMTGLRRKGKVTEADLRESLREIRMAMLDADVNYTVVKEFIRNVREKAAGAKVLDGLNPAQQIVSIVNEEMVAMMGETDVPLNKSPKIPTVIMMVGLQGAGKTTTAGKLAYKLKEENNARPFMIAADIYRPAAIDQLKVLGQQIDVPVFDLGTDVDPREIVRQGMDAAREAKADYVFIDAAGRLQIDEALMQELADIKEIAQPDEIMLVVDAMTGQNATETAEGFNERLGITGVTLTKLDGDTRGGAALSIRAVTGQPIKFVGQGEKMTDLDVFHPDRMASRILGMGDMLTLIEKAQKDFDEKQAQATMEKMKDKTFDFNDFLDQMQQVQNMGPMEDILKMIPGMANNPALQNVQINDKDMAHIKAIVYSMTPAERENPDLLNPSRRRRLAAGAGRPVVEVNKLIKQFNEMKKMMGQVMNGNMAGMEQMMGAMGMGGQGSGMKGKMANMAMKQMARRVQKAKKKRKR